MTPSRPLTFAILILAWAVAAGVSAGEPPAERESRATTVFKKVKPAFVAIGAAGKTATEDAPGGMGLLVDPKGVVLTNYQIVRDLDTMEVVLADGSKRTAKLAYSDPKLDLALLKVESARPLPSVRLADSDKVAEGDFAVILEAAFRHEFMLLGGVISGTKLRKEQNSEPFLRVDTAIGPGSSRGIVLNRDGEVIGIGSRLLGKNARLAGDIAVPSNRFEPFVTRAARDSDRPK